MATRWPRRWTNIFTSTITSGRIKRSATKPRPICFHFPKPKGSGLLKWGTPSPRPPGIYAFTPVWTFCLLCLRAGVQSTCLCRRIGQRRDATRAPRQVRCGWRPENRLPLNPPLYLRTLVFLSNRWGPPQALDRTLQRLATVRSKDESIEFIAGFLTSLISPGTMDHIHVLLPYVEVLKASLLWYGLAAGSFGRSALQNYGGGLGRRILREATRRETLLDRPRCDIALQELEMVVESGTNIADVRTGISSALTVEITPCIDTVVPIPIRPDAAQQELLPPTERVLPSEVLPEINDVLARLTRIREKLSSGFPKETARKSRSSQPEQRRFRDVRD